MSTQSMFFYLEETDHAAVKTFCVERGISIKEFMRGAIAKALSGTNKEIELSECRHDKNICWGTCGNKPEDMKEVYETPMGDEESVAPATGKY